MEECLSVAGDEGANRPVSDHNIIQATYNSFAHWNVMSMPSACPVDAFGNPLTYTVNEKTYNIIGGKNNPVGFSGSAATERAMAKFKAQLILENMGDAGFTLNEVSLLLCAELENLGLAVYLGCDYMDPYTKHSLRTDAISRGEFDDRMASSCVAYVCKPEQVKKVIDNKILIDAIADVLNAKGFAQHDLPNITRDMSKYFIMVERLDGCVCIAGHVHWGLANLLKKDENLGIDVILHAAIKIIKQTEFKDAKFLIGLDHNRSYRAAKPDSMQEATSLGFDFRPQNLEVLFHIPADGSVIECMEHQVLDVGLVKFYESHVQGVAFIDLHVELKGALTNCNRKFQQYIDAPSSPGDADASATDKIKAYLSQIKEKPELLDVANKYFIARGASEESISLVITFDIEDAGKHGLVLDIKPVVVSNQVQFHRGCSEVLNFAELEKKYNLTSSGGSKADAASAPGGSGAVGGVFAPSVDGGAAATAAASALAP